MIHTTCGCSVGRISQELAILNSAYHCLRSSLVKPEVKHDKLSKRLLNVPRLSMNLQRSLHADRIGSAKANGQSDALQGRRRSSRFQATSTSSAKSKMISSSATKETKFQRCFIAFGSNMGDRLRIIEEACTALDAEEGIKLRRTSGVWQTKAMYVEDQSDFLNGVLEIETSLEPLKLLDRLQAIENSLGRKRTIDKGPRTLDLDILLYGDQIIRHDRLEVPHKLMLERAFVLLPLCELIPDQAPPSSPVNRFDSYLNRLPGNAVPMSTRVQLSQRGTPLTPLIPDRQTRLMSILNVTPDSFSDGGLHSPLDPSSLKDTILSHLTAGATIIDVGGESTRPHATPVTPSEEKARVIPAIQLIKSLTSLPDSEYAGSAISIDTYHATVARAAVEAGADIVNDVSGGTLDPEMLPTVAKLGCTVIIMHMRGDPSTMTSEENTSYPDGLIETVGAELVSRVKAAEEAGIRRWRIILDPGIGFAKTSTQNLELLRRFRELTHFPGLRGMPWMVGASRKGFIGKITDVKHARERTWGTATAVAASVQSGADIVRVHDVDEMRKVVKMADAIWRVKTPVSVSDNPLPG